MVRQQVQNQDLVNVDPKARPTNQYANPIQNNFVPREVLDLAKLSPAIQEYVNQAQEDAAERARAAGRASVSLGRPFGAGVEMTPENTENRKQFQSAVEAGEILPTEDPWYRVGVLEAEARRVMLTFRDALYSPEIYSNLTRVYDENGNFVVNFPDTNEEFDRVLSQFTGAPALQTRYGQNVASDMADRIRDDFTELIAKERDKNVQEYHQGQIVSQLSDQMSTLLDMQSQNTPEARAASETAMRGFQDLRLTMTRDRNVDAPAALRMAGETLIARAALSGPQQALRAIDFVRGLKVGTTTIEGSGSPENLAFLRNLEELEYRYQNRSEQDDSRQLEKRKTDRSNKLYEIDISVSKAFAEDARKGIAPEFTLQRIIESGSQDTDGFADEWRSAAEGLYSATVAPRPKNQAALETISKMYTAGRGEEVPDTLLAMEQTGQITATERIELTVRHQEQESRYLKDNSYVSAMETLGSQVNGYLDGLSDSARGAVSEEAFEQMSLLRENIRNRVLALKPEEQTQIPSIVKEEADRVALALRLRSEARESEAKVLLKEIAARHGKGESAMEDISRAFDEGIFRKDAFFDMVRRDEAASDISQYTQNDYLQQAVGQALGSKGEELSAADTAAIISRAQSSAQQWVVENRKNFATPGEFRNAYSTWLRSELSKTIGSVAGSSEAADAFLKSRGLPTSAEMVADPQGPTVESAKASAKQIYDGVAIQDAIRRQNPTLLAAVAKSTYASGEGVSRAQRKFADSFGSNPAGVKAARGLALTELAGLDKLDLEQDKLILRKRALLSLGAVSPEGLLNGSVSIRLDPQSTFTGKMSAFGKKDAPDEETVKIKFDSADVDPWKTQFFRSRIEMESWSAKDNRNYTRLLRKYGVTEAQTELWEAQQLMLISANE